MSHKKSNSMIHVPFSWEKIPGVPKFMASPMRALAPGLTSNHNEVPRKTVLPLPPGSFGRRQPVRSISKRTFLWEKDPFLAAIIECTKDTDKCKDKGEIRKSFGTRVRNSKSFLLSCKYSFDVEPGHNLFTRPSSLGSLFGTRVRMCVS